MKKIDLILESIHDEYMINLLEEGTASELETLKTKKFLNENLNRIRKMLIEEGAIEGAKQGLSNKWGQYLANAGGVGVGAAGGALAANAIMDAKYGPGVSDDTPPVGDSMEDTVGDAPNETIETIKQFATDAAGNIKDAAGNVVGNIQDLIAQVQG